MSVCGLYHVLVVPCVGMWFVILTFSGKLSHSRPTKDKIAYPVDHRLVKCFFVKPLCFFSDYVHVVNCNMITQ